MTFTDLTKTERRVISECLNLYKELPCLWDNRQVLYSNKEARDQAYEVLLEKYRLLQEDATVLDLKRRIENMRTSYRREHKRVLLSRLNGEDEYLPQLWYYDHMTFLNDVMDFTKLEQQTRESSDLQMKIEFDEDSSSSLKRLLETPHSRVKKRKTETIYIQDQNDSDVDVCQQDVEGINMNNNNGQGSHCSQSMNTVAKSVSEAEAFGTTVGLQLKELDPMQKVYAEKLISDVIYNARLHRLTFNASLNILASDE